MNISKEVKTAILVLTGIALLIFGINYLRGENILGSSRVYFAEYENVEGLAISTPVTINGFNVGKVLDIGFKADGSAKLLVKLLVENDYEFSKNSSAQLYDTGLIGGKAIAIIPAFDKAEKAQQGTYLKGTIKSGLTDLMSQKLEPLQSKIQGAMGSADTLLTNLNEVLDEKTKLDLKNSIAALTQTLNAFKNTSNSLNDLMKKNQDKIEAVLVNAQTATANLTKITGSLSKSDLGQTVKNLESTLKNFDGILANLENGQGSMGKLLKDDDLYNNLQGATKELESLLLDFKLHPNRYTRILSKKEIPYKQPETK